MKRRRVLGFALLAATLAGSILLPRAVRFVRIGLGYAATITALQHFGSGLSLERIRAERLPPQLSFVHLEPIAATRTIRASAFGLMSVEARYRPGLGATRESPTPLSLPDSLEPVPLPPADLPWPLGSGPIEPTLERVRARALEAAVDAAFVDPDTGLDLGTHAVLVVEDGELRFERYAPGIERDTPLLGWSMTKTVTALLIGRLAHDGALTLDEPVPVAGWGQRVTIEDLLRMQSGMRWRQNYSRQDCDSLRMLFLARGAGEYAESVPLEHEPGSRWRYCDGSSNVLARIVVAKAKTDPLTYPKRALFEPLGMASASISVDGSGTFVGSSLMSASGRDWARIGLFMLQGGTWNGERLLDASFMRLSTRPTRGSRGRYGAHVWLFDDPREPLLEGAFYASGYQGQSVIVVPLAGVVLVRLGVEPESTDFDDERFATEILHALER